MEHLTCTYNSLFIVDTMGYQIASSKPNSDPKSDIASLSGNLKWQYNEFIGTKLDVGADVILFPLDAKKTRSIEIA
ncbi:hypothetical protein [Sporosarcina limicola]|uniref:Uncharacterized protein n=1 Tax=Sporosarcina limicola TaxID=34101 RepID=A0A927REL3_9BACL|nr:hypothetical protein [Sporosarcina limicola]MBE1556440.1 hypothetical protein [Sporosarcina limicola]